MTTKAVTEHDTSLDDKDREIARLRAALKPFAKKWDDFYAANKNADWDVLIEALQDEFIASETLRAGSLPEGPPSEKPKA